MVVVGDGGAKVEVVDNDGDSHMDSGEDSDATAAPADAAATPARSPAFASIGSPTVPPPESLQSPRPVSSKEEVGETKKASSD